MKLLDRLDQARTMGIRQLSMRAHIVPVALLCLTTMGCTPPLVVPAERQIVVPDDRGQHPMTMTIADPEGLLASVRPATSAEVEAAAAEAELPGGGIAAVAGSGKEPDVLVVWSGLACDRTGTVTVARRGPSITVTPDPIDNCDLIPSYRALVMSFRAPVAVAAVRTTLDPTAVLGE